MTKLTEVKKVGKVTITLVEAEVVPKTVSPDSYMLDCENGATCGWGMNGLVGPLESMEPLAQSHSDECDGTTKWTNV